MKRLVCIMLSLVICFSAIISGGADMKKDDIKIRAVSVHDPSIIKDKDGTYYAFGSHITTVRSEDLINWDYTARGYKTEGNVHFGSLSENLKGSFEWAGEDDSDCRGGFAVWAPDVYYNPKYLWKDGTRGAYMMYYSTSSTYKRSCIGLAVSKKIDGVYDYVDTVIYSGFTKVDAKDENSRHNKKYTNTNLDELIKKGRVCSYKDDWGIEDYNNITYPNAIDPCVYENEKGKLYLTYGSWSGGIFALELNEINGLPVYPGFDKKTSDGRMVDRYFGTHIAGGKGWSGEGPFIWYDKEQDYFYLQTSYEWLGTDGGYHVRMFRSKNALGPFTDMMGNSAVYGDIHHEHGGKLFGNYKFENSAAYTSGGHCSTIADDDGERYIVYHTRFKGTEHFEQRVHQMFMNEDGWAVVAPFGYMGSKIKEDGYSDDEIVGMYEYINHGHYIGEGNRVKESLTVFLTSDGKIRGAVEGTWSANGKYVAMNIDGEIYKGVFFRQLDESGREVMTFTLAGGENEAVWGVKADTATYDVKGGKETDIKKATVVKAERGKNPEATDDKATTADEGVRLDGNSGLMIEDAFIKEGMSIAFWMKAEKLKTYTPIIAITKDFTDKQQKWFSLTNFNDGKEAVLWSRNAEREQWLEGKWKKGYSMGEWQHVIAVFDTDYYGGDADCITARLYIDGYCVATGSVSKECFGEGSRLYIGINPWDACFTGEIKDMLLFDRALSHVDAFSLYNATYLTK